MRWGVVTFPGSNDDRDTCDVLARLLRGEVVRLWHKDRDLHNVDCVVLPGGFSYGDYLRPGAMARFSPVMESVVEFAGGGGLVLGIGNGFQILCESGLLPGALIRNASLRFVCETVRIRVEQVDTPFTSACRPGEVLALPIKHGEGCFVVHGPTLAALERERRIVLRYCDAEGSLQPKANPNGSVAAIAGIVNEDRNVLGLMPHPEHAADPLLAGTDGLKIFRSVVGACAARSEPAATGGKEGT